MPLDRIDDAVLSTLAGDVLRPRVVMAIIDGVLEQLTPRSRERELQQSRAALRTVEQGISNLAQAIAAAGELEPLLYELRTARARREELMATIGTLDRLDVQRFDRAAIQAKVHEHLDAWRACCPRSTFRTAANYCEKCSPDR